MIYQLKHTLFILLSLVLGTQSVFAQQKQVRILFVGNSYTYVNNLPQLVSLISDSTDTKLITQKSVVGGAKLYEHWNGERGLKTKEIILEEDFDIVVLQDYSMSALEMPDSTLKYVRLFAEFNRNVGIKTYLFNTWARKKAPQLQEVIDEVYSKCSAENNIERIPVGSVWKKAQQLRPTIELFDQDGSHPSELGSFLTACVFVASVTGELPENLPQSYWIKDSEGETLQIMYINDILDIEFFRHVVNEILELN